MKKSYFSRSIFLLFFIIFLLQSCAEKTQVMSYNIRYDNPNDGENIWNNRKEAVVTLIKKYHPDFLGIQEATYQQLRYIDSHTNYKRIGVGRDGGNSGEFSAIFYDSLKFQLLQNDTFWLSTNPDTISRGWDAALNRICTYGFFEHKKTKEKIAIFNTHFDHVGEQSREMSAKLILKKN